MASHRLRTGETVQVGAREALRVLMDHLRGSDITADPAALAIGQSAPKDGEGALVTCVRNLMQGGDYDATPNDSAGTLED